MPKYATVSIQDALKKRKTVNEEDTVWIPPETKEKSKGLFRSSTITGSTFLEMLKEDTVLRKCQMEFLETGKVSNIQVNARVVSGDCYTAQRGSGNYSERISWDTVEGLAKEPPSLPEAVYNWIPRKVYERGYKDALQELWEKSEVSDGGSIVPDYVSKGLKRLKVALDKASMEDRLHVHVGPAGTGKSTEVADILNKRRTDQTAYIVSLSNTTGLMFKQRVPGIRNYSCCAANAAMVEDEKAGPVHADYLVVDEFSQWGFEWLRLLVNLVERNDKADIYLMGDVNQIPTFLSSGNLLYAVCQEYPSCVTRHETQYRFSGDYKDLLDGILDKHKFLTDACFARKDAIDYRTVDCVVTGTNKHVEEYAKRMFEVKHSKRIHDKQKLPEYLVAGTRLICDKTTTVGGSSGTAKVYRNERFVAVSKEKPWAWTLKSEVDGRKVEVHDVELDMKFVLGYAMTVNRAQGLEWDNVVVSMDNSDANMKSFSPLYVALSRGRKDVKFVVTGISKDTLDWYLSRTNKYTNHFDCIKYTKEQKGE